MSLALFEEVKNLSTEQRNPSSIRMDELSTEEILRLINDEDAKVAHAVELEIPHIAAVVDVIVQAFRTGGRLFYAGAGTSGRMGVVDASECPPTFGTAPEQVQAIMAGGAAAVFKAVEGAEDLPENGAAAVRDRGVGKGDIFIGLAASKRTPFVLGALKEAHDSGAYAVLVTTNPRESIDHTNLDESICPVVGPEVLMGSTRMKSAVAQKLVLTMITTTAMVRLGKVYENMMVDLQLTNKKLEERAKRIIMIATGCDYERAQELLKESSSHVKTAIIMQKGNVSLEEARKLLEQGDGFVKRALRLIK